MSSTKNILCQQLLLPLSSPKKMAPFNNNMHYKTNFSIGIPGMPFTSSTNVVVPEQHKMSETDIQPNEPKYIEPPKLMAKANIKATNLEDISPPKQIVKPAMGKVMVEEEIENIQSTEPMHIRNVSNKQPDFNENSPSETINKLMDVKHVYERYASEGKALSRASEKYPSHEYRKDPIGLFLPSQYEDAKQRQKEKNENFIEDLRILKMRKVQERQEEERKEEMIRNKITKEWASIGSKEEYQTIQYKNHQELSNRREHLGYLQFQKGEMIDKKQLFYNSTPREKLPKNYTGKDIIHKMQQNWYKDLVGTQRDSMFQGVAKQIVK